MCRNETRAGPENEPRESQVGNENAMSDSATGDFANKMWVAVVREGCGERIEKGREGLVVSKMDV